MKRSTTAIRHAVTRECSLKIACYGSRLLHCRNLSLVLLFCSIFVSANLTEFAEFDIVDDLKVELNMDIIDSLLGPRM